MNTCKSAPQARTQLLASPPRGEQAAGPPAAVEDGGAEPCAGVFPVFGLLVKYGELSGAAPSGWCVGQLGH